MNEQSFMNEGGVMVTSARAVINGTMYSMANISSVSVGIIPASRGSGVILAIVGAIIAAAADGGGAFFGVVLLLAGILMAVMAKATYMVRLGSASGEATALSSKDEGFVSKVVSSLNQAIIARG